MAEFAYEGPAEPTSVDERRAKRAAIRQREVQMAERRALTLHRSLRCSGDGDPRKASHAGEPNGCISNGTNCICECHDYPLIPRVPTTKFAT